MTAVLSGVSRSRVLPAIGASVVAAVCVISVEVALGGTAADPAVGDYLARICRAMGLQSCPERGMPLDAYVPLLLPHGVITADLSKRLRADDPLTHDFALEVASRITEPLAPSFLSTSYLVNTFLADQGIALGIVRNDIDDQDLEDLFNARGRERQHHCPTPRYRHAAHDDPCPPNP